MNIDPYEIDLDAFRDAFVQLNKDIQEMINKENEKEEPDADMIEQNEMKQDKINEILDNFIDLENM